MKKLDKQAYETYNPNVPEIEELEHRITRLEVFYEYVLKEKNYLNCLRV